MNLRLTTLAAGLALLLAILLLPGLAQAQAPEPHQAIQEYTGPATCEMCHVNVTNDVIHSAHYTWEGKLDQYSPVAASTAAINWLGMLNEKLDIPAGCGRCHIGSGALPTSPDQVTAEAKAGIDCLICHSPIYDTSLRFPVQDASGAWALTQDRTLLAARQAQRPTTENCLLCHQNVGGGQAFEHNLDVAPAADKHGEGSKPDVHLDAGMQCVDCHASDSHRVMGFSPTLHTRDLPDQRLTCDSCHTSAPHSDVLLNQRHARLDCRACHVTGTGGLVMRDWTSKPVFDPLTELYAPVDDVRAPNSVQPIYRWHNGQIAQPDAPWPGSRSDLTARIQPFKLFTSMAPVDAASGQPIPLKLEHFYAQGDLEQAIASGAAEAQMDYSGAWESRIITQPLQISHGVAPKEQARPCQDCHVANGVMDFASMGYTAQEVAVLTSISNETAGVRQPLQLAVVVPAAQPLPTPINLSGDLEADRGFGIHIPWNPILVVLVSLAIVAGGFYWLRLQRPPTPAAVPAAPPAAAPAAPPAAAPPAVTPSAQPPAAPSPPTPPAPPQE